jgi:hypothetical protein
MWRVDSTVLNCVADHSLIAQSVTRFDRYCRWPLLHRGPRKRTPSGSGERKEAGVMSTKAEAAGGVVYMDNRESADLFDQIARRYMGISGTEFLTRWDAGEFEGVDWDEVPGLAEVATALPFAR